MSDLSESRERDLKSPWAWAPFRRLATAQVLHALGDAIVAIALANTLFFSVPVGEARGKVALYLALTMAPFAVLSPLVGPWLDRRSGTYRVAIVLAAVGRALLAVLLTTRVDRLSLYPLAFGLLVLSRVHGVSRSALVPDALPPGKQLMWGNAWLAVLSVAGGAIGAGAAAATNAVSGPGLALWGAFIVFAVSVVPAFRLPRPGSDEDSDATSGDYRALLTPRLLAGGVAMAASRATVGFLTFLMAFLLRAQGETGRGFAVVIAAAGIGGFLGSVVGPALRLIMRESMLLLAALAAVSAVALWAATSFDLTKAAIVAAVVGAAAGAGRLAFDSLLQREAPSSVRGRTFARYETVFQLCWVGGAGLATAVPFRATGGLRTLALLAGVGIVLAVKGLLPRSKTGPANGRDHRHPNQREVLLPHRDGQT
ncbi:MAG: MFS transporter [Actinomycetota bacterium]|nr:MFS transporter [Actinomycetota bacterium]